MHTFSDTPVILKKCKIPKINLFNLATCFRMHMILNIIAIVFQADQNKSLQKDLSKKLMFLNKNGFRTEK